MVMDDGSMMHSIWTSEAIPFSEFQAEQFKLKTKRGRSGVDWVTDLPTASAQNHLKVNFEDQDEIYSELLVYL